ncbi:ABC transporter substrate-binding protein [Neptuniibacter sp.]|uniref:substrate-binding periplasmic protein n=1 Tax=Neptuniibacter sp. TaxID=1962643 RepID=UPI0026349D17|nr:transporter substrate-binding domain-containing protein [Neptuniibacter sp.]MCP4594897.1 transporter substrate-binding domain-containing protein [Neptuniibacter sp.]
MLRCFNTLCAATLLIASLVSHADERIELIVPSFKPYTYFEDGEFKGIGVEKIEQVFAELEVEYTLTLAPNYGRAVDELKKGRVDGLFLASENEERNAVAEFSSPIMINRWSWFLAQGSDLHPSQENFKQEAQIATHLNTNTHKWLSRNGYNVGYAPSDTLALPRTLHKKRISAVFLAELVFIESSKELGLSEDDFIQVVEIAKPFGIYISKAYLEHHPGFMQRLNTAIEVIQTEQAEDP